MRRLNWLVGLGFVISFVPLVWSVVDSTNRCDFINDKQTGWKCVKSDECLPERWICDGQVQCPLPDESDETMGCNLYPNTGCKSWYGRKHIKCPDGRCKESCDGDVSDEFDSKWQCKSGMRIPMNLTCDGSAHCDDESDEEDGCNLYPEEGCKSWYGRRHVKCNGSDTICTLPTFLDACRQCEDPESWRCDDGYCIKLGKVQNGLRDCMDGSDESIENLKWWNLLIITVIVSIIGLSFSFLCRLLRNKRSIFHCVFCRTARSSRVLKLERERDGGGDAPDEGPPLLPESCPLPFELISIFEKSSHWRDSKKSLLIKEETKAQHLYALVHRSPEQYRSLYRFISYRFSTPAKLSAITEHLFRWEKDFHGQDAREALACWRLHLGSNNLIKKLINAIQPPGLCSRFYDWYMPKKNTLRQYIRRSIPKESRSFFRTVYMMINTLYYLAKPFVGTFIFYFDVMKDLIFSILIYNTVDDLTLGNFSPAEYPFETTVVIGLFTMIMLTQVSFMVIAVYYSNDVFEMCRHSTSRFKRNVFKAISFVFAPLMPAFLLANHVYYLQQEYTLIRELQTLEEEDDSMANRWYLFREIERTRYRSRLHRRIYSFFRVSAAVIQSFHVIVAMIVIVVSPQLTPSVPLIDGVTEKIADFINLERFDQDSFINNLDIARDVVIVSVVLYSFVMIISAFVRYVYQCKNLNLVFGGKLFLTLYFACHVIARLIMYIALLATSSKTKFSDPPIPIRQATIIGAVIFFLHYVLIFWFKMMYVSNFKKANIIERSIHVLVNTVVVIPFMAWDVDSLQIDADPHCCEEEKERRTQSMKQRSVDDPELKKMKPEMRKTKSLQGSLGPQNSATTSFTFPNISAPLIAEIGDLREKIIHLWWEKPSRKLTVQEVVKHFRSSIFFKDLDISVLERTVSELERDGFINKELYNPQKTKREYFWLLIFHILANIVALIIEIVNGGTYTSSGMYYSWDVRLGSFFFGFVFLLLYYRKYHVLSDLTGDTSTCCTCTMTMPVVCCVKEQPPLTAIPVEEELIKFFRRPVETSEVTLEHLDPNNHLRHCDVTTQTSIIEEKRM